MRKHILFKVSGYLGFALAAMVLAGHAHGGIAGTKHDLSATSGNTVKATSQTEICIFCHTPHSASVGVGSLPLWNHNLSAVVSYGTYTSDTFDGASTIDDVGGATNETATVTNLCLSCHDGTVAVNSINRVSSVNGDDMTMTGDGLTAEGYLNTTAKLDSDLTDDHPINFTYDATLVAADGGLHDPTALVNAKLFGGTVQCASCHDPHTSAQPAFLRASMDGSGLCLECHAK